MQRDYQDIHNFWEPHDRDGWCWRGKCWGRLWKWWLRRRSWIQDSADLRRHPNHCWFHITHLHWQSFADNPIVLLSLSLSDTSFQNQRNESDICLLISRCFRLFCYDTLHARGSVQWWPFWNSRPCWSLPMWFRLLLCIVQRELLRGLQGSGRSCRVRSEILKCWCLLEPRNDIQCVAAVFWNNYSWFLSNPCWTPPWLRLYETLSLIV